MTYFPNIGLWHISSRPGVLLYKLLKMGNVEEVLASRIPPVFFTAFVISAEMWYGSSNSGHKLVGPSRYHWDIILVASLAKLGS